VKERKVIRMETECITGMFLLARAFPAQSSAFCGVTRAARVADDSGSKKFSSVLEDGQAVKKVREVSADLARAAQNQYRITRSWPHRSYPDDILTMQG
jgi:hypothetical protein